MQSWLQSEMFLKKIGRPLWTLPNVNLNLYTLKSLINEHARLDFSDFLSTLFAIFHVINKKFHPARLLIYLVKKEAG